MSIGIDFGIGIDQNSWYRTGIVSKPKKLVSPITKLYILKFNLDYKGNFKVTVLYCILLYCSVLYCTVLYCTILYCTVLHCTVLHCTVYCTVYCVLCTVYCTVLYCTVLYCK